MLDFFWRGHSATEMGLIVQSLPPYKRPVPRRSKVTVPGLSGQVEEKLFPDVVWEQVSYTVNCAIRPGFNRERVMEWLSGEGELSFSHIPYSVFMAAVEAEFPAVELVEGHPDSYLSLAPTFVCQPWRYDYPNAQRDIRNGDNGGVNPYGFAALPFISVQGPPGSTVTFSCGGNVLEVVLGDTGLAEIDCEGEWISGGCGSGDFPALAPGRWTMQVTGVDGTSVSARLRTRYRRI